jgi:type III pantothenate kinase
MNWDADLFTIDLGNSNPHIGCFKKGNLTSLASWKDGVWDALLSSKRPICLANVGLAWAELHKGKQVTQVANFKNHGHFLDMHSDYEESIGDDRIVQAYFLYRKKLLTGEAPSLLLIDAGTFITLDFITQNGHHGGMIYPGPQTFLNSYTKGAHLPKLNAASLRDNFLMTPPGMGRSTQDSITQALKHYLREIPKSIHADNIVLTGGYAQLLLPVFREIKGVQVQVIPELIHTSLNYFYHQQHNGDKPVCAPSLV